MEEESSDKFAQFEANPITLIGLDTSFKRFRSAPGAASSARQESLTCSGSLKTAKSFGRRSYSTPDATPHNPLPGGRDVSTNAAQYGSDNKLKCTKEEIERKRLEAIKKRDIERKRQEAIRKRQISSQKLSGK